MILTEIELFDLERKLESNGQIALDEILYYDYIGNIRVKKEEDDIETVSITSYRELMEQSSGSSQPKNMQTDTSQEGNVRTYEPGQPPRIIYNEYREPEEKYNPRGKKKTIRIRNKRKFSR